MSTTVHLPRLARALLALILAVCGTGCCVDPPKADVILDLGFRSPEQTFLTFQTGMKGNLPRLEYACLSSNFRARQSPGLSQLIYREFRDEWMKENPWLRKGITEATVREREELSPNAVRLVCSSYGQWFELVMVRESFAQAWSDDDELYNEFVEDIDKLLEADPTDADGGRDVYGGASFAGDPQQVALTQRRIGATITELRIGSEWKIDDIRQVDPPPATPES